MTTTFFSAALTTSYTYGPTIKVAEACDIVALATVSGLAPTRVEMLLEVRETSSAIWLPIPAAEAGADGVAYESKPATVVVSGPVFFQCPGTLVAGGLSGYEVRVGARRVGGDATTTLALAGELRTNRDSPSLAEAVFASGGNPAYDPSTGALLVTPTRTMADDYTDPEEWVDETNQAIGTYYYPSAAGVAMTRYDHLTLVLTLTAGTVDIEVTNDGGTTWQDVTPLVLEANAATAVQGAVSITADAALDMKGWNFEAVRVKAVMAGAGTNEIVIWAKRRKA